MDPNGIAERARRLKEEIAAASVEVTSDDHAVTVVVGPGNAVRELYLSQRAFRHQGAELGALVVQTIREANTRMSEQLSAIMAEYMGHGPESTSQRIDLSSGPFAPLPAPAQLRAEVAAEGGGAR